MRWQSRSGVVCDKELGCRRCWVFAHGAEVVELDPEGYCVSCASYLRTRAATPAPTDAEFARVFDLEEQP